MVQTDGVVEEKPKYLRRPAMNIITEYLPVLLVLSILLALCLLRRLVWLDRHANFTPRRDVSTSKRKTPPERGLRFTVIGLVVRDIHAMVRYPIPLTAVLQANVYPALR